MKQVKILVLICIALIGFTLITQAAVNALTPKPKIVSVTTSNGGVVLLNVKYTNTETLYLCEYINNKWEESDTYEVEYSAIERTSTIIITGLAPGLHTFRVKAISSEDSEGSISDSINVYVN